MSEITEELLPCPFCGGPAHVEDIGDDAYYAECDNAPDCAASGGMGYDRQGAIDAWNRRQPTMEPVPDGSYQDEDGDSLLEVDRGGEHILVWGHGLEEPFCLGCTLPEGWRLMRPIESPRSCRVCGCTDDHACEGGCYWVEADLCSACVGKEVGDA